MKQFKLFFACALMSLFSLGQVWATEASLTSVGTKEVVTTSGGSVSKVFDGVTCLITRNSSNQPGFYTSSGIVRYYSGDIMTLSVESGYAISQIDFVMTSGSVGTASPTGLSGNTWTGSAESVSFTGGGTVKISSITVTYAASGGSDPSLSATPTTIDFGTVDQNASVAAKTVAVTFSNLTGSVTYSGLSGAFAATGTISNSGDEITITPSTGTIGNYNQTLTIQSTADSKSQDVTVTMNVVEPFDGLKLTFDVSSNPGEWPTANNASLTNYTYTLSAVDYTFGLKNVKCNSGYLMLTSPAVLGLPAISGYKLVKVEATNSSGCSTTTKVKVTDDEAGSNVVTGGAEQTWGTTSSTYTYTLSGTAPNTMYYLIVGNKNCQLVDLTLYYVEDASTPKAATPTFTAGDENFLTSTSVILATATEGAAIRFTTDGTDPTSTSTLYSDPIELSATTTIKAIAIKDGYDNSAVAEKTFTKGTKLTVAEAIALIPNANDTQDNQYVEGYVCTAGTSVSSGQMTYYISDDGTETNRLQIYKGKNLNNTNFSAISDLGLQDKVVVFGQLKNYSGTPEMNSGNYIVERVAATVATPTFTPDGGGFLTTQSVTLACTTDGAEIRYTTDGSDPTELSTLYSDPIELSATTTITAAAFKGGASSSAVARTFTKGTKITVADALLALDSNDPIENQFVYGKVSTASTGLYSGKLTYYISDDGSTTNQLEVYNGYGLNGAVFTDKTDLQVGDEVTVYGTLTIYNTTKEFAAGSYLLEFNRPVVSTYSITYEENGGSTVDDATDQTHLPDPLPTTTKSGKAFGGWYTTSTFDGGTEAVAGAALTGDITLYAKWDDLSPWATVYTSNVEMSGATASTVVISENNYDAMKAGTGSAAGSVDVAIPAQATTLHFHASGWADRSVTLNLTAPAGITITPASVNLTADAGVSGGESTYTLANDPSTTAYFAVTLSGNTDAFTLNIANTGSKKQFVLFGVNQEGGVLPVLESIEITGDLDNKTGYRVGDALDLTGLTVMATYSLAGTPQAPVDITTDPELTLTYDPLVENQTEVTITATYKGQTDDITISGLDPVASATPEIITDVNSRSWTVTQDAAPADKTFTVTLNNVAAATAALGGTNPEAFNIDKTALVDGDVITVSVVSTATVGSYTATITITDNAGVAADKVVNVNLTVNAPEVPETPVSTTSKWVAATEIVNGMTVIIVGVNGDEAFAMGEQGNNNRAAVPGTLDAGVFTPGDNTMPFTVVAQEGGTYALQATSGKYLYAASSSSNYLRSQVVLDDNGKWTLTTTSAVAIGANTHNTMFFNSSSSIFACYTPSTTTQKPIALYVPQAVTPTPDYTRTEMLGAGVLGTICVDHNVTSSEGATFYEVAGFNGSQLVMAEVTGELAAGVPYVFQATGDVLKLYYGSTSVAEPVNTGALKGTFSATTIENTDPNWASIYYFANHALYSCSDLTSLNLPANRAYLVMSQVGGFSPMPGRRYFTVNVNGKTTPTGMENLENGETPVKIIIDGQLFILRGEKLYDATGRLVK